MAAVYLAPLCLSCASAMGKDSIAPVSTFREEGLLQNPFLSCFGASEGWGVRAPRALSANSATKRRWRRRPSASSGEVVCLSDGVPEAITACAWNDSVLASDMPVLVEFWASWCGPCRMVHRVIDEIAQEYARRIKCYKLNTDDYPQFATSHNIDQIPAVLLFEDGEDKEYRLPRRLDRIFYLISLAVFGIFGVFTRYLLQKFFGPGGPLAFTGDSALYLDLPSNMLGSFLMGWFGFVFKAQIGDVSEHLAVGLTTGYLGSLTTFSGWNQKMLELSSKGHWVQAVAGFIIGMSMAGISILVGVSSAEGLQRSFSGWFDRWSGRVGCSLKNLRVHSLSRHITVMTVMVLLWGLLWALSWVLVRTKLDGLTSGAVLWLGCLVGPPGVWIRWYLARFNGQGLGRKGRLKWLPVGTLSANILAACLMAALATISKAVNTKRCSIIVSGIQFGFLGCLSTVSTFIAEVFAMWQSGHRGRAYAYIAITILPSFVLGTLIYSVPVRTMHYMQ